MFERALRCSRLLGLTHDVSLRSRGMWYTVALKLEMDNVCQCSPSLEHILIEDRGRITY